MLRSLLGVTSTVILFGVALGGGPHAWAGEQRHQRVAYLVLQGSSTHIGTMNDDGSGRRVITRGAALDQLPAWSPSRQAIVFSSDRGPGFHLDLWLVNPQTDALRRLAHTPGIDEVEPAWSPDGERLAFVGVPVGSGGLSTSIYVMKADGSHRRRLTRGHQDGTPAWSPNGRLIVFSRVVKRQSQLFVMTPGGRRLHEITFLRKGAAAPDWSPGGTRIVFQSGDLPADIYVRRFGKSGATRITRASANDQVPAWSPCGDRILYQSDSGGDTGTWSMHPDGSEKHAINRRALSPAWKPKCLR